MNEIDLLRNLDTSRPTTWDELDVAWETLMSAIDQEERQRRTVLGRLRLHVGPLGVGGPRKSKKTGAVVAIAASILVVAFGTGWLHRNPHQSSPSTVVVQPAAFLQKAAIAARTDADFIPRPDEFLYVQQGGYRAWLSVDGTHDGLIDNGSKVAVGGCRDGVSLVAGNYVGLRPQPCTVDPAYLADAPTTASAMVDYILTQAGSNAPNPVGKEIIFISEFHYLRPAARAALYEAAASLPGISMSSTTVTNRGQPATAITWSFGGAYRTVLLFDPTTYAYLGSITADVSGALQGSLDYRQGIVGAVGDLP